MTRSARVSFLFVTVAALMLGGCAVRAVPRPVAGGAPRLYADCRGAPNDRPTVILESGAFGAAADWDLVLDGLAKGGKVCAYDRSGIGQSSPRGGSRDAVAIARELRGLLDQIGERKPVILVGHSNGALYVETFAALYPGRTAGLVYVNGVTSNDLDFPLLIEDLQSERRLAGMAATMGSMGFAGPISGILTTATGLPDDAAQRKRESIGDAASLQVAGEEDAAMVDSLSATRKLGGAPALIPVVVIGGSVEPDSDLNKSWRAAEAAAAGKATVRWVLEIPGATHTSPLVRDRAYIVTAVNWLRSFPPRTRLR